MADAVRITFSGHTEIFRKLATLPTVERRKCVADLGALQVQNIKDRVDRRQGIGGGTYPASKRAQYDNGTTLLDTGAMLKSMGMKSSNDTEAVIGFGSAWESKKAIWNQEGTRAFTLPKGKAYPIKRKGGRANWLWSHKKAATPPRPFFGVSRGDYEKIVTYATGFYRKAVQRLGLSNG